MGEHGRGEGGRLREGPRRCGFETRLALITAGPCTVSGSTLAVTGVGTCTVTASQTGNASWAAATPVSQAFRIAPAALTITAPSVSRTYGVSNPAFTPALSGFVNGDSAASLTTRPTCTTTAASISPVGTYTINCLGAVDPNYSFSYVAGILRIAIADRFVTQTNTTLNVAAPGFLSLTSAPGATVVISTKPAGKLTLGSSGAFTYVPKTGFTGTDSFAYRLSLGGTLSAPVTVTIYVVGMGVNCAKCNVSGLGLSGANLLGANLASANMAGARLDHAILALSNLSGADLSYATLDHANLTLAQPPQGDAHERQPDRRQFGLGEPLRKHSHQRRSDRREPDGCQSLGREYDGRNPRRRDGHRRRLVQHRLPGWQQRQQGWRHLRRPLQALGRYFGTTTCS